MRRFVDNEQQTIDRMTSLTHITPASLSS